jgi:hypothetical protein
MQNVLPFVLPSFCAAWLCTTVSSSLLDVMSSEENVVAAFILGAATATTVLLAKGLLTPVQ